MKTHIETIANFIATQMDGEQVPPHNSAALARLSEAVKAIQQASDRDLAMLALRVVSIAIDRIRSSITAERALHDFIQPGDRHV